jgi:phage-related protein
VQELTAEEKQIALLNATVEAGRRMVDEFGGGQLTAAEKMAQFRATLQNTKDQIGLALLPALQALLEPLAELAQKYGPQVVELAQRLGEWLGENLPVAIETLTALLSGEMPTAFQTAWGIIEPIVTAIRDVIVGQVWPALQAAFANLTEALAKLGLDWGDVWGAIKEAIKIVAVVIGAAILGIVGALTAIIATLASVLEHVTSVLADIAATFQLGLESIARLVGGAMAIVKGIFTGDLELIAAGWAAWKEGLIGLITAFFQGAVNIFNLMFGTIINAVVTFISTFINFFVDLKNTLVGGSIVQEMMSAMLEIISSTLAEILSAITGFISDVVGAFSDLAGSLYDIGASMMEGLKGGIMSKVGEILSAIRDIIANLIQEAKDALDIFSPSGVFAEIGRQMMEGMALGITGSAALPAAAAVGAAAGATRTTNNYFNLTVHSRAETSPVVESFETMRALVG